MSKPIKEGLVPSWKSTGKGSVPVPYGVVRSWIQDGNTVEDPGQP